jgi:hypothetical protein
MRSPTEIKILEKEAQVAYIKNLYAQLPEDPITQFEFELERTIWWDIERAEEELALM